MFIALQCAAPMPGANFLWRCLIGQYSKPVSSIASSCGLTAIQLGRDCVQFTSASVSYTTVIVRWVRTTSLAISCLWRMRSNQRFQPRNPLRGPPAEARR